MANVDKPKPVSTAPAAWALLIMILAYVACGIGIFAVTLLPWLIGVGWMMHHWLGV
jgi:hypothetical protein